MTETGIQSTAVGFPLTTCGNDEVATCGNDGDAVSDPAWQLAQRMNPSSTKLRIGIIGCGDSARRYAASASLECEVAAVMDSDAITARQFAREVGAARVHSDHWDLIQDGTIEAVLIASPSWIRGHQAREALEAGKHVLCNAPLGRTLEECDLLTQTAARRDLLLMTGFLPRDIAAIQFATHEIHAGTIGEPIQVRCDRSSYVPKEERRNGARTWTEAFSTQAGETLDLSRLWLGEALTVSADVQAEPGARQAEDVGNMIVNHERGVSVHHITRASHQTPVHRYLVDGTEGSILVQRFARTGESFQVTLFRKGRVAGDLTRDAAQRPQSQILDRFAARVRAMPAEDCDVEDGRKAVEGVLAAFLSSRERIKVSLPLHGFVDTGLMLPGRAQTQHRDY